ncbi:hypothetical protein K440DRAFT_632806 [Wilcoxina mikolae CBS 423.85]|nr:hypothetical protein K440DRAFT_632806 [Wilcoxina mikolae CBS 423.85]
MGTSTTITTLQYHHIHTPPSSPRPAKRRRLSPSVWNTSQAVLTPPEVQSLLISAGISPAIRENIETERLTSEHLQIPKGLQPIEWILKHLHHLDALPPDLDALPSPLLELLPPKGNTDIPEIVTHTPQHVALSALHLPIPISGSVWTLKLPRLPTAALTAQSIQRFLPTDEQLLFRGTDLKTRGFFTPVFPAAASAEFGPGLYTTPSLEYATHMAGVGTGVVYVFRVPEVMGLRVFEARGKEWEGVVKTGGRRLGWRKDVVVGGVSRDCWEAKENGRTPKVDETLVQCVWRTGEACRRIAEGCVAVFFIEMVGGDV